MPGGDGIEGRAGDKATALSYGAAMPRRYAALLRAVTDGGTGTLAMSDLIAIRQIPASRASRLILRAEMWCSRAANRRPP